MTIETIMTACLQRGLTMADLDRMTLGQAVDFIISYNNSQDRGSAEEKNEKKNVPARDAVQKDFDRF